jgi:two-component system, OmpR family, sensor histidine kinase MprB
MSLRLRLALVVAVTFAVVVAACVYAAHVSASNELHDATDQFLLERAKDPVNRARGDFDNVRRELDNFGASRGTPGGGPGPHFAVGGGGPVVRPDALVQVIDSNGDIVVQSDVDLPVDDRDRSMATTDERTEPRLRTVTVDHTPYRVLTASTGNGAIQIAREAGSTENVLDSLDMRLLLIGLGGTIVAALLAWFIARRIVRPVEQLTDAAEHVAQTQDLQNTITVDRTDELGRLATSFNTMLTALDTSRDQQKRLVMDASHELRTPLTALRTNVEVLQRGTALDDAQRAELLGAVDVELRELTDLVGELVDLATDARAEEPPQPTDLAAVADAVVARQRQRTGRDITFAATGDTNAVVRAGAIERAVSNLVDNACKFSPADTTVDVRVDGRTIEVADRGPGVSDEDRSHVFDRFYRAPAARTLPGSGLGLSIVQQIVETHGGQVQLLARADGGTIARITLASD